MPNATGGPAMGFQAIILCGPGVSLNPFTSSPDVFPKALVPIANRPMVWHTLDWCHRMGLSSIHLVTPPSSLAALSSALSTNPHLTSLSGSKPVLVAPEDLTQNSSTAEILRLPEIQAIIHSNFIVLPCDIICEVSGSTLMGEWLLRETSLAAEDKLESELYGPPNEGLVVWHDTRDDYHVKGEETDFVLVSPSLQRPLVGATNSIASNVGRLLYSVPTDTLKDITESDDFLIRQSLLEKHSRLRMISDHRDAHIYFFPYWVAEMIKRNDHMENISEDVLGWWAKAGWQNELASKLQITSILYHETENNIDDKDAASQYRDMPNIMSLSSTGYVHVDHPSPCNTETPVFAGRVSIHETVPKAVKQENTFLHAAPAINVYVHTSGPEVPLIRRVDTTALLLSVSLRLAELPALDEVGPAASPFAHTSKIAYPEGIGERCIISKENCLLAENVTTEERCTIKQSVIGPNCHIGKFARLTKCLLMEGAIVEEACQLEGCIIGRRAKVGKGSKLKDCEIQEGVMVQDKTESKNEKFTVFDDMDGDDDEDPLDQSFDESAI